MKVISSGKITRKEGTVAGVQNTTGSPAIIAVNGGLFEPGMRVRFSGIGGATEWNGLFWVVSVSGSNPAQLRLSAQPGGSPLQGTGAAYTQGGSVVEIPRLSNDFDLRVSRIRMQVVAGEVGRKFLGTREMDSTSPSRTGVLHEFWPNSTGGLSDNWEVRDPEGENSIELSELFVDIALPGEGLIVTAWQS